MSTSDNVRAILGGTIRAYQADPAYRDRPDVHNELLRIGNRLNEPSTASRICACWRRNFHPCTAGRCGDSRFPDTPQRASLTQ